MFKTTIEILLSDKHTLIGLAEISGIDPFEFYNGADLQGLDLRSQDLRGLNFEGADLRFSLLDGVEFDRGAFNGSVLGKEYEIFQDEFCFNSNDVLAFPDEELLMFARFRKGFVDECVAAIGLTYEDVATNAKISTSSLRKARNEKVIAIETAQSVVRCLDMLLDAIEDQYAVAAKRSMRQPHTQFLVGGNNGPFRSISRSRIAHLLDVRKSRSTTYRDTAENLEFWDGVYQRRERQGGDEQETFDQ